MKSETLRRLAAIERVRVEPLTIWLPAPEGELAGWEILPGDGRAIRVDRLPDENEAALEDRAGKEIRAALRESNPGYGLVTVFGYNDEGVTR